MCVCGGSVGRRVLCAQCGDCDRVRLFLVCSSVHSVFITCVVTSVQVYTVCAVEYTFLEVVYVRLYYVFSVYKYISLSTIRYIIYSMAETYNIRVSGETRQRLKAIGNKDDTYNYIVENLLDMFDNAGGIKNDR